METVAFQHVAGGRVGLCVERDIDSAICGGLFHGETVVNVLRVACGLLALNCLDAIPEALHFRVAVAQAIVRIGYLPHGRIGFNLRVGLFCRVVADTGTALHGFVLAIPGVALLHGFVALLHPFQTGRQLFQGGGIVAGNGFAAFAAAVFGNKLLMRDSVADHGKRVLYEPIHFPVPFCGGLHLPVRFRVVLLRVVPGRAAYRPGHPGGPLRYNVVVCLFNKAFPLVQAGRQNGLLALVQRARVGGLHLLQALAVNRFGLAGKGASCVVLAGAVRLGNAVLVKA